MEFKRNVTVNAPADKVWQIVGTEFNEVSKWADPVLDSQANPNLSNEEKGRICQVKGAGEVVETIYRYDDQSRELAFILTGKKIPFFMRKIDSRWSVKPKDGDQAEVQVHTKITLMPVFSQLISGSLSKAMGKQVDVVLGDLKYYVENGAPKVQA